MSRTTRHRREGGVSDKAVSFRCAVTSSWGGGEVGGRGHQGGARCQSLRPTLMRPPVVKGQKYPLSGFLLFFRLVDASIVGHRQRVLT